MIVVNKGDPYNESRLENHLKMAFTDRFSYEVCASFASQSRQQTLPELQFHALLSRDFDPNYSCLARGHGLETAVDATDYPSFEFFFL